MHKVVNLSVQNRFVEYNQEDTLGGARLNAPIT